MQRLNELIQLISQFDNENKFYWIDKLDVCKADKGFLVMYFNLL